MSRFERIARDLEKLPVELHNNVLVELEFQQIIRISHHAGPGLTWSIQDSLSPWGVFFRDGNTALLQKLLALTDRLKRFCFRLRDAENLDQDKFDNACSKGPLWFIRNRGPKWRSQNDPYERWNNNHYRYKYATNKQDPDNPRLVDAASLSSHWLCSLNEIAISTTWRALHADYSRDLEPWIAQLDGAATIFDKIPLVGKATISYHNGPNVIQLKSSRTALSVGELSDFIDLYQKIRLMRAEALAQELHRLADLYEAHSSLLKTPFAPQTPRSNKKHIPSNMRCEARKIVKRASTTWWNCKEKPRNRFAYPFPALVPYSWTMQLFCKVLNDGKLSESLHPETIVKSCKNIMQQIPAWAPPCDLPHLITDDMAGLSNALDLIALGPKHLWYWETTLCAHTDEELNWLESFAHVVAWMEVEFPETAKEVRGHHWEDSAS
jgi:hypothetical protein